MGESARTLNIQELVPPLVERARKNNWCVQEDHCILRIVYDYACLGDWREQVKSPAYKNLNEEQFNRAEGLLISLQTACPEAVELLHLASMKWRGKI